MISRVNTGDFKSQYGSIQESIWGSSRVDMGPSKVNMGVFKNQYRALQQALGTPKVVTNLILTCDEFWAKWMLRGGSGEDSLRFKQEYGCG